MKRIVLSLVFLLSVTAMMAVPAYPGTAQVRQPDGSYITLRLLGDEWMSFNTTVDGYSVVKNSRGYYVYAQLNQGRLQPTDRVAHDAAQRSADEQVFLAGVKKYQAPDMSADHSALKAQLESIGAQRRAQISRRTTSYDKFRGLIILVEFEDKEFSRPDYKDIITDMVNMEDYKGYEKEKFTGSVRDYFYDNSGGRFTPQFDVVGPYKVGFSQYDCNSNTGKCDSVLFAAIDSAAAIVNYKDYDGDKDGRVDLIYFIVAGYGANYVGNNGDLWWPHRSVLFKRGGGDWRVFKHGVQLFDYASSTELGGYTAQPSTIYIDGIGTICHEFSHVLGLPDFYDTNYSEDGKPESNHPGIWSLMAGGSYENKSRSPVGYSLYERYSVGFTEEPKRIEGEGEYTLKPLYLCSDKEGNTDFIQSGYRINSPVQNEFFLFENRQKGSFKWDAYLPTSGMLVHRVELNNKNIWENNEVNANPDHMYYELVRAGGTEQPATYDVFPGRGKVTALHNGTTPANLRTWSGRATKWGLFDISMDGSEVKFTIKDAVTLESISLPDTAEVGVSVTLQLTAELEPDYAVATYKWTSSDVTIATVDKNGVVTGVSEGVCEITVTSSNGKSATCKLTVKNIPLYDIDGFKTLAVGSEELLQLSQAEVLLASGETAFVRDASGALMLVGLEGLKANDVIDGVLYVQSGEKDKLPQALVTEKTIVSGLTIAAGDQVQPREVKLEDLAEKDYCDYVMVKAAKMVSKEVNGKKGVYLESGDRSVRFFNSLKNLGINKSVTMPKNYVDKYFDVPALYATFVDGEDTVDAVYLLNKLVEVADPTGIVDLQLDKPDYQQPVYNLQGQRVSPTTKGLLIRGGRKYVK